MLKWLAILLFTLRRWKQYGQIPEDVDKCIVVGGPHTSNFDLLFAYAGFVKMKAPVRFLIKKEWLRYFPIKNIFLSAGAVGIDRAKKGETMVDKLAELLIHSEERMAVLITPEATRKHTCKWKTGFYYAALKANVPIYLSHLDYAKKEAVMGPGFMPTGDFKKDMEIVRNHYKDVTPKYPEKFCLKIYLDDESEACPNAARK